MNFMGTEHNHNKANTKFAGCVVRIKGIDLHSKKPFDGVTYIKQVIEYQGEVAVECFNGDSKERFHLLKTEVVDTGITSNAEGVYFFDKESVIYGSGKLRNTLQYKQGICTGRFTLNANTGDTVKALFVLYRALTTYEPQAFHVPPELCLNVGGVLPITNLLGCAQGGVVLVSDETKLLGKITPKGLRLHSKYDWMQDFLESHLKSVGSKLVVYHD